MVWPLACTVNYLRKLAREKQAKKEVAVHL